MSDSEADRREGYKYCWKCYEKAHGFIPDQWNPWVRGKCESCGLSTECFRSPTEWEKKNVYEHLQTDHAGLPAFVAELEALEAKTSPGPWRVKTHGAENYIVDGGSVASIKCLFADTAEFIAEARNHAPALLALVRQLQGENAELTDKIVKAKALIDCKDQIVTLRRKMTNGAADPLTQRIVLSLCDLIVEIERSLEDG